MESRKAARLEAVASPPPLILSYHRIQQFLSKGKHWITQDLTL